MFQGCWKVVGVVLALGLSGCEVFHTSSELPEDPFFLSRTPVESVAKKSPPVPPQFALPTMPPHPLDKLRERDVIVDQQPPGSRRTPGVLTNLPAYLPAPTSQESP